ncbi:LysR family transcriptional regulator [Chromobacterium phragmitis]|uniref:LysR family transcriptional regulator n=1 Tax=Chromobacterium phragmitis TaxID=2202141 RepID=A0A344UDK2_9NEIS|nr:LysR family transcriptional regulator [Chromobacterium phragmitis]AXE31961.1 LysR family transcriptional regulator [Chromobacterium phragmitis]AXE33350.1 LysR family transcriptional regulator [Chromobacterium phragmitis]
MKPLWGIRIFCAVVEQKSFVAAARQLGISPSSATRALQALEEELGAMLLARSSKQVELTMAGEAYYPSARQMLDLQQQAEEELSQQAGAPRGLLRFSAPETLGRELLPAVLARLADAHSGLRFEVLYSDSILEPIRDKLDFSIRGAFPASSELIGHPLWHYRRHLYASPDYVARHGEPRHPSELPQHRVVIHSAPRVLKAWNFVSDRQTVSLNLAAWHRSNSGNGVLDAVRAGMGIARLGDWLAEPMAARGELVRLCPDFRIVSSQGDDPQMHAVFANRGMPRKARLLLDALRLEADKRALDRRAVA